MDLVKEDLYCANSVNYLIINDQAEYILALCNSHLINWFFKKLSTNSNVNGYEVDNIPIKLANDECKMKIKYLIDEIKSENSTSCNSKYDLEMQLNDIVYDIYHLSTDEIEEVEKIYL